MKLVQVNLFLFAFVTAAGIQISAGEFTKQNGVHDSKVQPDSRVADADNRLKRQAETTTTPRPKKPRPSNIFSLISVLLTETRDDANRAFGEIGTLFNSQFSNATTPRSTTTSTATSSSSSDSDEDNEIATTTEEFRITRDEFLGILRSNVQGIRNLFGKEFRVAIRDSNQNARDFGRDLGLALRPYFTNDGNNNKNSSKNKT